MNRYHDSPKIGSEQRAEQGVEERAYQICEICTRIPAEVSSNAAVVFGYWKTLRQPTFWLMTSKDSFLEHTNKLGHFDSKQIYLVLKQTHFLTSFLVKSHLYSLNVVKFFMSLSTQQNRWYYQRNLNRDSCLQISLSKWYVHHGTYDCLLTDDWFIQS